MIELLVSSAIIVAAFLASSGVAQKSLQISRQAVHTAQASFLLEEGAEAMRVIRDNNWANIEGYSTSTTYYLSFTGGTWTLTETPSLVGAFTRTVEVADVARDVEDEITSSGTNDPDTRLITINISWPEGGTTVEKTLSFYLSNLFNYGS